MKKLLIVTDFYLPHQSGITTYIQNLTRILNKKFDITILTGNFNNKLKKIEKINNIKIIRSKTLFKFNRGFFSINLIKEYIKESKKADYINIHFPLTEIMPLIFLSKKPIFLNYHCLPNSNTFFSKIIFLYFYFFGFISLMFSKKVIVFTKDYFYSFLFHKLIDKKIIEILPFIENKLNNKITAKIKKNKIINIGFLGRLSEEKGLEYLIYSSNLMIKKNIQHTIKIAGDLDDKRFNKYINKILMISKNNKNINFLGKLNEEKKKKFYNSIDIFVLPSVNSFEAFGLVQLEAMSYGKPVIASNLRGVRIPILYTKNGLLFKKGNVKNLVECIEYYYKNLNKINNRKIYKTYNKNFNKNDFKKNFLSLFNY